MEQTEVKKITSEILNASQEEISHLSIQLSCLQILIAERQKREVLKEIISPKPEATRTYRKRQTYTEEQRAEVLRLSDEGISAKEISARTNVEYTSVLKMKKRAMERGEA